MRVRFSDLIIALAARGPGFKSFGCCLDACVHSKSCHVPRSAFIFAPHPRAESISLRINAAFDQTEESADRGAMAAENSGPF
eukprot:912600-Amphidinium_carterae.1